jgi:predicted metalloprotease
MILQQHIIAHEIGHHVQTLLGTSQNETNARRKVRLKPINISGFRTALCWSLDALQPKNEQFLGGRRY